MIEKQLKESKKYYNAQGSLDIKQFTHGLNQKLGEKRNKRNILFNFKLPIILAITLAVLVLPFSVIASFKYFGMDIIITPNKKDVDYQVLHIRPLQDDFVEYLELIPNSELIPIETAISEASFGVRAPGIEGWKKVDSFGLKLDGNPLEIIDIFKKGDLKVVIFQYHSEEMTEAKKMGSYELYTYETIMLLNSFGDNLAYLIDYQFDRKQLRVFREEDDQIICYSIYSNGDLEILERFAHVYLKSTPVSK